MPTWNSDQYLKFARERTQPSIDLAARIDLPSPARVVDLGSGPGNSTAVLARRWPSAALTGIDSSGPMLATARKDHPQWTWEEGDIARWTADRPFDVVFANASLQWVPDHGTLLPRLFAQVAPGGALAFQVPANQHEGPHQIIRELAASAAWQGRFQGEDPVWHVRPISFYYDVLAPISARLDLWETSYIHVLDGPEGVTEWYRGTGLRPWLERLSGESAQAQFLHEIGNRFEAAYPRQPDGKVLFPFRRLFAVAYAR